MEVRVQHGTRGGVRLAGSIAVRFGPRATIAAQIVTTVAVRGAAAATTQPRG
jgi:hypothetical protein